MSTVRTRFAPSPTGYMHIGGMRTALFNWLWARHNSGSFVLRIDDTDRARNCDETLAPILEAFRWLSLGWDEGPEQGGPYGPYFQSERGQFYRNAIEQLLADGNAWRDFDPPEVTRADRKAAEKQKRQYLNVRRSIGLSPQEIADAIARNQPHVVRLLVPRDQTIVIDDVVRGRIEWDCGLIADPVLARADGSPLYNLATAVDDAQMRISHVIRAEEHLSNTPVQVMIHRALNNPLPVFAHIPYVAAPGSREKLSKRKLDSYRKNQQFKKMFEAAERVFPRPGLSDSTQLDPVMVEYYERIGYLPEAVLNALARLGWSLDDETEILPLSTVVENFTLDRVVKSPAGFDPDKLLSYQSHWIKQRSLDEKIDGCLPHLVRAGHVSDPPDVAVREFVGRLITAVGERLRVFGDILDYDDFFTVDECLEYDVRAFDKRLRCAEDAAQLLRELRERLETLEPFTARSTDDLLHKFVEARGIKIGQIIHALRVAVTGKSVGPGMFDCLELLGRHRSLSRIDRALSRIS